MAGTSVSRHDDDDDDDDDDDNDGDDGDDDDDDDDDVDDDTDSDDDHNDDEHSAHSLPALQLHFLLCPHWTLAVASFFFCAPEKRCVWTLRRYCTLEFMQ